MMVKKTLYLDEDLADRLRQVTAGRKLNRFINDTLAEKIDQLEADRLEAEMKAGYVAVKSEREELVDDWSAVDLEHWPS